MVYQHDREGDQQQMQMGVGEGDVAQTEGWRGGRRGSDRGVEGRETWLRQRGGGEGDVAQPQTEGWRGGRRGSDRGMEGRETWPSPRQRGGGEGDVAQTEGWRAGRRGPAPDRGVEGRETWLRQRGGGIGGKGEWRNGGHDWTSRGHRCDRLNGVEYREAGRLVGEGKNWRKGTLKGHTRVTCSLM